MPVFSAQSPGQDYKFAFGSQTTVTATDSIASGLRNVLGGVASFQTDPADANMLASVVPGTNGNFTLKTWKTDGADPTPAAASSFGKVVNWFVWGS